MVVAETSFTGNSVILVMSYFKSLYYCILPGVIPARSFILLLLKNEYDSIEMIAYNNIGFIRHACNVKSKGCIPRTEGVYLK